MVYFLDTHEKDVDYSCRDDGSEGYETGEDCACDGFETAETGDEGVETEGHGAGDCGGHEIGGFELFAGQRG